MHKVAVTAAAAWLAGTAGFFLLDRSSPRRYGAAGLAVCWLGFWLGAATALVLLAAGRLGSRNKKGQAKQ